MTSTKLNVPERAIFNRDNIDILRGINSGCVDLIYLDPPFNTKKSFTAPIGSSAEGASFKDIFYAEDIKDEWLETIKFENTPLYNFLMHTKTDGIAHNYAYLAYMAIRLIECHRVLSETGSIYLHVDATMSHYLKVVMDSIFGERNFKNEVVWDYKKISNAKGGKYNRRHDTILFYSKGKAHVFNHAYTEISPRKQQLIKAGYNTKNMNGEKYIYIYDAKVVQKKGIDLSKYDRVEYVDASIGTLQSDIFNIDNTNSRSVEYMGYPTQKPLALLERIITVSSNKGDVVLDPFCGCATACVAAERLERRWIGIDISIEAYNLIQQRLENEVPQLEKILWKKKINFSTYPPARTDQGLPENVDQGYIYIISHPILTPHYVEGKMTYKVGIARNFERRLASYQTGSPGRSYAEEYKVLTPKYKEIEQAIFKKFQGDRENEWVTASKMDIIAAIQEML